MSRTAYFDCFSGCSGDMILGALLDAGLNPEVLQKGLSGLNISGYRVSADKVMRSSIAATKFNVIMEGHIHHHRSLSDILRIIDSSRLSKQVKNQSRTVFRRLGEAEAKVHNINIEEVHFHELGAVDTIVDIVGSLIALEEMQIEQVYSSPLPVGNGNVSTAHGILPVPAPATLQLLADSRALLNACTGTAASTGELVTPTGAALVTCLADFRRPAMTVDKVGYGAGSREFPDRPNVLRVWIGEEVSEDNSEETILLETNIDDMNPQIYGYLMEKLFAEKALDVWFTPVQMKKNRPGVMLTVLVPSGAEFKMTEIILRETSTLGVRVRQVSRHIAQREIIDFDSSLGRARIKVKRFSGEVLSVSPEYEDCRRIALERSLPFQEVYRIIESEARLHPGLENH